MFMAVQPSQTMDSTSFSTAVLIDNYLESVEALPDALQRNLSQLRELDQHYQEKLKEVERFVSAFNHEKEPAAKRKCLIQIQRRLVKSQEYGDEKLEVVGQMMDMADTRSRQIEIEMDNIDTYRNDDMPPAIMKQDLPVNDEHPKAQAEKTEKTAKRNRRPRNNDRHERDSEAGTGSTAGSVSSDTHKPVKKKSNKRKSRAKPQGSPTHDLPIDPNEPTYCLCNQVSFGEMIGCDNDECPIEWFHFQCVGLTTKPKGKWYCPKCTQERKRERSYLR